MAYRDNDRYPTGLQVYEGVKPYARVILLNEFDFTSFVALPFSQKVRMFVDSSTTSVDILDDEEIRTHSTNNDFYGFLSSAQEHLSAKPKTPLIRKITIEVSLETYVPRKVEEHERVFGQEPHRGLPNDWYEIGPNILSDLADYYNTPIEKRWDAVNDVPLRKLPVRPDQIFMTVELYSNQAQEEKLAALTNIFDRIEEMFPGAITIEERHRVSSCWEDALGLKPASL